MFLSAFVKCCYWFLSAILKGFYWFLSAFVKYLICLNWFLLAFVNCSFLSAFINVYIDFYQFLSNVCTDFYQRLLGSFYFISTLYYFIIIILIWERTEGNTKFIIIRGKAITMLILNIDMKLISLFNYFALINIELIIYDKFEWK